jgi:hypothetical protein
MLDVRYAYISIFNCLLSDVFSRKVAFHAVFMERSSKTLRAGDHVICEHVVYNASDSYDPKTGMFTVPVSGVYCFSATSTRNADDGRFSFWADIMLDKVGTTNMAAHGRGRTTAHAVVHASAGQKVFVKSMTNSNDFYGDWNTIFSGFLICPDV